MTKYEFTGFSAGCGAYVQGALSAIVFGPENAEGIARDLADLMARGYTRRAAGAWLKINGFDVKGFRVLRAGRVG